MTNRNSDMNAVVHSHAVAFLAFDRSGRGLASRSAGSGTLVDFLGIRGIVTAAHVASVIRTLPEVGVMRFKPGRTYEALTCRGDELEVTAVGEPPFGRGGPDLAFVRLPIGIENSLASTNAFFNSRKRAMMQEQGHDRTPAEMFFVTGVISELSRAKGILGNSAQTEHAAMNAAGYIKEHSVDNGGVDSFDFVPVYRPDFSAPTSYSGLSGGGLWQLGAGSGLLDRTLVGVAYYQSEADQNGERTIRCHGPLAVYEVLYLAVLDRYAPEAAAEHRATAWPE